MTFRPSVLPDRDNNLLSTFTRTFEATRQAIRQDQADRRAQQELESRLGERAFTREREEFALRADIARDPTITVGPETGARAGFRQQARGVTPAGRPDILGALRGISEEAAGPPRVSLGMVPGTEEEAFFEPRGRERAVRREAKLQREIGRPEREEEAAATAQERQELDIALESIGVPVEERRALVRDPASARRRINAAATEERRGERPPTVTGTERVRAADIAALIEEAEGIGKPIDESTARRFLLDPAARRAHFAIINVQEQRVIQGKIDAVTDGLQRLERDRQDLSAEEFNSRRRRLFREQGFADVDDFNRQRDEFQEALAGGNRLPIVSPDPPEGPLAGLGGESRKISDQQVEGIAPILSRMEETEREAEIRRIVPDATQADVDALMDAARAVGR